MTSTSPAAAPPTFPVHCCECSEFIATTECETAATSPVQCQDCHQDYIRSL
jgi:hypothetical protein